MAIDKSTISRPVSILVSDEASAFDPQALHGQVTTHVISQLRKVDSDCRGVDLEHISALCDVGLNQAQRAIISEAGGWSKFIDAETKNGDLRSFKDGSRTMIGFDTTMDAKQLREGLKEIMAQENTGVADSSWRKAKKSSTDFMNPDVLLQIDPRQTKANVREESRSRSPVKNVQLTRHNQEVLEVLPRLLGLRRTEFYKDAVRQDSLRFARTITLLMRFRDIFQGRTYEQIVARLIEEGDISKLGGLNQLLEMGVKSGYLKASNKGDTAGHVATQLGYSLISPTPMTKSVDQSTIADLSLLEEQLSENYLSLKPTPKSDALRARLVKDVQRHLDREFSKIGFLSELFGSGGNGLYFPGSDSDVCIYYSTVPPSRIINIQVLGSTLRRARWCSNVNVIAHAKIPVVKLVHTDSGLPVDISIENTIAIENTRLIKLYMDLDARVKPLAFAIKVWCKSRAISHPEEGSLSSYSWTLMLIHYLQRTDPPVLPNLQQDKDTLEPFSHTYQGEIIHCYYDESPAWKSQNEASTSALFLGFFKYFTHFPFGTHVINLEPSLLNGQDSTPLLKSAKGVGDWQRKSIAIQDPFIEDRNTGVGTSPQIAGWIMEEIGRAYRILGEGGSFADIVGFGNP